jgi:hypothetical protein
MIPNPSSCLIGGSHFQGCRIRLEAAANRGLAGSMPSPWGCSSVGGARTLKG